MAKNSKTIPSATAGLPPAVAEVYSIPEGQLIHFVCAEFGEVNLTTVTLDFAEQLAEKGYLIKT